MKKALPMSVSLDGYAPGPPATKRRPPRGRRVQRLRRGDVRCCGRSHHGARTYEAHGRYCPLLTDNDALRHGRE